MRIYSFYSVSEFIFRKLTTTTSQISRATYQDYIYSLITLTDALTMCDQ